MKSLTLLLLSIFMASCTTITPQQMKDATAGYNLPYKPEKGEGMIYVVRPSSLGYAIRFNVFLDDEEKTSEMGWNRGTQYIHFFVRPGEHTLYSVAENTDELKVNVKEGETVFVRQDTQMGIIMARNSLQKIGEVEGTYSVMKLNKGTVLQVRKADPNLKQLATGDLKPALHK